MEIYCWKKTNANGVASLLENGFVLIAGGINTPRSVASTELYNSQTNTWHSTPNATATWSPLITGFNATDASKHYGFISWKNFFKENNIFGV